MALGTPDIIIDDESYFTVRNDSIPNNAHYYAFARGDAPDFLRCRPTKKFEVKLMVWLAISPKGISKPHFQKSGVAVTKESYQSDCIVKKLVPFINEFHGDGNFLFWPDLASSHYATSTLQCFDDNDIPYVSKEMSPPAAPVYGLLRTFGAC